MYAIIVIKNVALTTRRGKCLRKSHIKAGSNDWIVRTLYVISGHSRRNKISRFYFVCIGCATYKLCGFYFIHDLKCCQKRASPPFYAPFGKRVDTRRETRPVHKQHCFVERQKIYLRCERWSRREIGAHRLK